MVGIKRKPENIRMPTMVEFSNTVAEIYNLRDRAFISFIYLTGARISEIVGQIKRFQIEFQEIGGIPFILVNNVLTLKRRTKILRTILIPADKPKEQIFLKSILDYILPLPAETILFNFSRQRALQIVKNKTYLFPHYLRHMRLTHLITEYNFTERDLVLFTGWKDSRQATTYAHLNILDIARKFGGKLS